MDEKGIKYYTGMPAQDIKEHFPISYSGSRLYKNDADESLRMVHLIHGYYFEGMYYASDSGLHVLIDEQEGKVVRLTTY